MREIRSTPPRPSDTDDGLIAAALRGDTAAFEQLVRRHYPVAIAAARSFGGREDAEDIVQDAFVRAFAKLHRFQSGRPFRPWLVKIVANESSHYRRSRGRRDALASRSAARAQNGPAAVDETVSLSLAEERLLGAVRSLGERDRMVIVCRYLLELSEQETADVLGCPPGTVKSRLSRALERLRQTLPGEEAT
jgi:RNA polymerase sigma factor (sigma-70 family)